MSRCNINLRTATRILVKVGTFPAMTFDDLFDGVKELPWKDIVHPRASFPGSTPQSTFHLLYITGVPFEFALKTL